MPIPSFTDTLGGTLGPGITIIHDGDVFNEAPSTDEGGLNIEKMNAELAKTVLKDDIFFMPAEDVPSEDIPFQMFLKSRETLKH